MRKLILLGISSLFCLIFLLPEEGFAGRIEARHFHSDLLDRDYAYQIFLPDGYESGRGRYPVLYLLHGSRNGEKAWIVGGRIRAVLDRLITEGKVPPLLAVLPGHRGAWWIDNHRDQAESAFIQELIPHVDTRYRTVPEREGRLIAGASSGGYGVIRYIVCYPELFLAAAALSPAMYLPLPPSNSAAYSEPAFLVDGRFDEQLWLARHYGNDLPAYEEKKLPVALYIGVGNRDEFGIVDVARDLHDRLGGDGAGRVVLDLRQGNHSWAFWREAIADGLLFMAQYLPRPAQATMSSSLN